MNEATWDRVKRIFHDAMARPLAERYSFLDDACADDLTLRSEVEQLLAAHDEIGDSETASLGPTRLEVPGATIGRYKLLQRIGEGGFGVVYMAEQQEPVRRRVALKVIKLGMDTKQVVARFEAERQALAMMDHPNIAKVLDAGATETGRPYFVMELVKGISITRYCDDNKFRTAERLKLFVEVCHAVQHAHQKGIIHRDIKPSNVMVTLHDGKPVPKVIDFGVAKATQQRLTERTLFTSYGQFIGTPAYMSPEQAEMSGLDVDTRSDVYSLGVLLYELLIGTTPFDASTLRSAAYSEIQRILRDVEPPKPSTRLGTLGDALGEIASHRQSEPAALARRIRGDLDWIVMKALQKDRTRRYASASEFAADVVRHIDNEPIVARPQSALYRLRKLATKHRVPVTLAAALIAAIVILGSVAFWQGRVAQQRAEQIRQQSMQVRASSILNTAAAAEDPALQVLLLTELKDAQPLTGRLRVARDVANRPMPAAILRGHVDWVIDVAVSPDGRLLATASADEARIWNAAGTGRPIILKHDAKVLDVSFSPDGKQLLTSSRDDNTRLWPVDGIGEPIVLAGTLPSFHLDGTRVATANGDTATVWHSDGTGDVFTLSSDAEVSALAYASDGSQLVTGHADGTIRVWPAGGTTPPTVFRGHADKVTGVMLDVDDTEGHPLATYADDGTLCLWSLGKSEPQEVYRLEGQVKGDRVIPKWSRQGSEFSVVFTGALAGLVERAYPGSTLAVSPDGRFVADGYWRGAANVWGAGVSGESLILHGGTSQVLAAAFSRDGTHIVTGHADGTARVWPIARDEPRIFGCMPGFAGCRELINGRPFGSRIAALDADLSPDGSLVATAWSDGTARIQHVDRSSPDVVLTGHEEELSSIDFHPDGTRVVTASHDQTARIWTIDGKGEPIVLPHEDKVVEAVFSPDGTRVVTGSRKGTARIWSADGKGEPVVLRVPVASAVPLLSVAFSADGTRLATGGPGQFAWVWRADGIGEPIPLEGYEFVWSLAFSPDGTRVALGCGDGQLRIWNADGSGEPQVIHEHLDEVFGVAFSPDGTRIATASQDGTIRVRWLDESRDTLVLRDHKFGVRSVVFSSDGNRVVSAGVDGTARLWRVSWPELMSYFADTVRACLTPDERTRFLAESPAEAHQTYSECERRQGR